MSAGDRQAGYAPRNALNADALKAAIAARSRSRGDSDAVRAWLLNHFLRHAVANFEPARPIRSVDDARAVLGSAPLPAWVAARFRDARPVRDAHGERDDRGDVADPEAMAAAEHPPALAPVVWVDPGDPALVALEAKLVEFLESRRGTGLDGKLDRINCPQALALWEKEHAAMSARIARGWRESVPEASRPWLVTPNGRFVEFVADSPRLRDEMAFESYVMRHCLGQFSSRRALTGGYGERYAESIEAGRLRVFSFRDAGGQPHVTIGVTVRANGLLDVDQVKGKQNRPPVARYLDDVLACLDALGTSDVTPPDCIGIGIVRTPAGWRRIEAVGDAGTQAMLVARYPELFPRLVSPTPAVEWLVAARHPELLAARAPRAASVRYAARAALGGATADAADAPARYATEGVEWPGYVPTPADAANR